MNILIRLLAFVIGLLNNSEKKKKKNYEKIASYLYQKRNFHCKRFIVRQRKGLNK